MTYLEVSSLPHSEQRDFFKWHESQRQWHFFAATKGNYKWHLSQALWHDKRLSFLPLNFWVTKTFQENTHRLVENVTKNNTLLACLKARQ